MIAYGYKRLFKADSSSIEYQCPILHCIKKYNLLKTHLLNRLRKCNVICTNRDVIILIVSRHIRIFFLRTCENKFFCFYVAILKILCISLLEFCRNSVFKFVDLVWISLSYFRKCIFISFILSNKSSIFIEINNLERNFFENNFCFIYFNFTIRKLSGRICQGPHIILTCTNLFPAFICFEQCRIQCLPGRGCCKNFSLFRLFSIRCRCNNSASICSQLFCDNQCRLVYCSVLCFILPVFHFRNGHIAVLHIQNLCNNLRVLRLCCCRSIIFGFVHNQTSAAFDCKNRLHCRVSIFCTDFGNIYLFPVRFNSQRIEVIDFHRIENSCFTGDNLTFIEITFYNILRTFLRIVSDNFYI